MSMTVRELNYLEDIRADFDGFLAEKDWEQARICINDMGDRGAELEALKMHQELNRAEAEANDDVYFEPYEHTIPVETAAEYRARTLPEDFVPQGVHMEVSHGDSWGAASVSVNHEDHD
jgi:hypothetical protein